MKNKTFMALLAAVIVSVAGTGAGVPSVTGTGMGVTFEKDIRKIYELSEGMEGTGVPSVAGTGRWLA